jgi:hypothetical protein
LGEVWNQLGWVPVAVGTAVAVLWVCESAHASTAAAMATPTESRTVDLIESMVRILVPRSVVEN